MNTKNAQEIRHNDIKVGEKIIEVKYAPKGLRSIERGLMNLASSIARGRGMSGYLVIINPLVTEHRMNEGWARALETLREDLREHLYLVTVKGDRILGLPGNVDDEFRKQLEKVVEGKIRPEGTRLLPKNNYNEILKILTYRWLKGGGPLPAKEITAEAGCTYPTLANVLARLGPLIKRGPKKSIELSHFPKDEWSKLVSESDRIRSTMWFVDRSGQPREIDTLLSRLQNLRLPHVAVGGVYGTKYHYAELDLIGNPCLVLSVHCRGSDADLKFVQQLDPAFQRIRLPLEPPNLVLHFIRRPISYYVSEHAGLNVADPVECLLDLHEAHLESQALGFLNHLTNVRSKTE